MAKLEENRDKYSRTAPGALERPSEINDFARLYVAVVPNDFFSSDNI